MDRSFHPPKKLNKNSNAIVIISLLLCVATTNCYTLEGQWRLDQEHLSYTKLNPNVTFSFTNKIRDVTLLMPQDRLGGSLVGNTFSGTKQLTVYACKTLLYNYYVNESSLYIQPISVSSNNYACLKDEIE